jgi:hypothetical protein
LIAVKKLPPSAEAANFWLGIAKKIAKAAKISQKLEKFGKIIVNALLMCL